MTTLSLKFLTWLVLFSCVVGGNATKNEEHRRATKVHQHAANYVFVPYPHRFIGERGDGESAASANGLNSQNDEMPNPNQPAKVFENEDINGRFATALSYHSDPAKDDGVQSAAVRGGFYVPPTWSLYYPMHIFSAKEALVCLNGRKIRVAGDSYMVEIFIALVDILSEKPSNELVKNAQDRSRVLKAAEAAADKLASSGYNISLHYVAPECRHGTLDCLLRYVTKLSNYNTSVDAFVANILIHHVLLMKKQRIPADADASNQGAIADDQARDYVQKLRALFKLAKDNAVPITWATGPSYNISAVPSAYQEITRDAHASYFNSLALQLAMNMSVPSLNIQRLTGACRWSNCTTDGGHRARYVNRMKAQMWLNLLCRLNDSGESESSGEDTASA